MLWLAGVMATPALIILAGTLLARVPSPAPPARADTVSADSARGFVCDGRTVTAIAINPERPPFSGQYARWRRVARALGLHHTTTIAPIVRRFVSLDIGQPCTEFRRSESERILRAQPYLASATVRAEPDGPDGARVVVRTVDEVPVLVAGKLRHGQPAALALGNENTFGRGLLLEGRFERGFGSYRNGYGIRLGYSQLLGRPYTGLLDLRRDPAGHSARVELAHPFLTDLQRVAWHLGRDERHDYLRLGKWTDQNTDLALSVRRQSWDVGGVVRFGHPGALLLAGGALTGERSQPEHEALLLPDSGIFALPPGTAVPLTYPDIRATRINAVGGVRAIRYLTVRGFDALTAEQDLARGVQIAVIAGRGVRVLQGRDEDFLISTDVYAGAASPQAYLATRVEGEAHHAVGGASWDGIIGSGRTAYYFKQSDALTFQVSLEGAGAWHPRLPVPLTLGGSDGVRGFGGTHDVGQRRLVGRVEQRWYAGPFRNTADIGVAAFADAGRLWAGSAPYARTTPVATSVGLSLLAALPRGAQRVWRLDVAVPVRGPAAHGIEIGLSTTDVNLGIWDEPRDVTRARSAAGPARVFAWP